jgi:hypothetical protein
VIYEACRWCEARDVLRDVRLKLPDGLPLPVEALLDLAVECIAYGREQALRGRREEHAAAAADRFGMLEIGEPS